MFSYSTSKIFKMSSPYTDKYCIVSSNMPIDMKLDALKRRYKIWLEYDETHEFYSSIPNHYYFEICRHRDLKLEVLCEVNCKDDRELTKKTNIYIKENYINDPNLLTSKARDRHNEKMKEKYECECGMKLSRGNKRDHEKTKKHLLFINQQL